MNRGIVLSTVCAAGIVVGCDKNAVAPPTTGSITLRIVTDAPARAASDTLGTPISSVAAGHLDAARVRVIGPTNKSLNLTAGPSGFSGTVDGLAPGGYTVVVEGLVASEVDYFGQTSGVQVTAGRNASAAITFASFRPVLGDLGPPTAGMAFTARWVRVANASNYRVEWDKNPGFASPSSQDVADTFATITVADTGTYNIRVRAVNAWEPAGRPSDPSSIRLVGTPPLLQNGVPQGGLAGETGSERFFAIHVPSSQNLLTVTISGGTGDANLYLRFGTLPTRSVSDCGSSSSSNTDQCSVPNPSAGDWYVMLHGFAAYSGVSLTAAYRTTPPAPTALTATAVSGTQVDLAWTDNSTAEDGFRIERCVGQGCTAFVEIATVAANVTTYQNTGLTAGTSYGYRVRAYSVAGNSAYSNTATATPPTVPATPTGLTATAVSGTEIDLAWTDNASNEDGFRIERCEGAGCTSFAEIATVGPNVTTYANTGATAGTSYSYQMRAYGVAGNSGYSNTATATPPTVPASPTGLTATAVSGTQNELAWTDNATNEDGYRIERCAGAGCTTFAQIATVGANVVTYRDAGLTGGTSYSYQVRAYNVAGNSGYSNTATGLPPTVPVPPSALTATPVSGTQIDLVWTDNAVNEDGFRVERCEGAGCTSFAEIATVGANVVTYRDAGLTAGASYSYRVRAHNVAGNSGYSNTATAVPPAVPVSPTGLTVTAVSATQIDLAWTDNATNEDGFRIERCNGAGCTTFAEITTVGANVVTYQDAGLTAGTSYSYRVRAYNVAGSSGYSNTATATPPTVPASPTGLTATVVSGTQIDLAWTDNATNEDGYRIERCAGAGCTSFAEIATVGANVATYQDAGLTGGTSYSYQVRAYNVAGNSGYSNTATRLPPTVPAPPSALTATPGSGTQIDLVWTDNAVNEEGFRIERCVGAGCVAFVEISTVGADVTTYQDTGLTPGTSYSYRARTYNLAGNSAYSNTATAAPPTVSVSPTGLTATSVSATQIDLAWTDNSTTEDGYRIERCSGGGCTAFGEIATVGVNATTYQNTGLTQGTGYSYRVRAYNVTGNSEYSNTAMVPVGPSGLGATAVSGTQIDLAWTDNATDEDGFRIEQCQGANCSTFGEIATVGANVTSYQNLFLTPGTSYSYRVRAFTTTGTSAYSAPAAAATPLPAPSGLTATAVSATQISLAWQDNSGNEDGFRIERCAGAGCTTFGEIATVGANVAAYANPGLTAGTGYSYRVRAYNGTGSSTYSNTAVVPVAPTNLTATAVSGNEIDLAWTDNATDEDGFRIEYCAGVGCTTFGEVATVGANVTSYQAFFVSSGTSYSFRVRAHTTAGGTSSYSNTASAATPLPAPSGLTATAVSATQISLAWQDNSGNEDGFRIERCAGAGCTTFGEIATVGANVTAYANPGLTAGTGYSYRVRAHNAIGNSSYSNTATATTPTASASVSAGDNHTCRVTTAGVAYCWGNNFNGQLGDGSTTPSLTPVAVAGGLAFQSITAGQQYSCGVTTANAAYCWGAGDGGNLGNGSATNSATPSPVVGGLVFQSVSAGTTHSCGVTSGGAAYCWGNNSGGQLGIGSTASSTVPVAASGGLVFQSVSAGATHSCGVTTGGDAYCWGESDLGQVGDGSTAMRTTPVPVSGGHQFRSVSAGIGFTCGVTSGDVAYCWGNNFDGQLGNGLLVSSTTPTLVSGGLSFGSISAGGPNACGVTTAGAAYCWGDNSSGQLGNGLTEDSPTPSAVVGGLAFQSVSASGSYHTCGLTTSGAAYCWGNNASGQLGNGTTVGSNVPVLVSSPP